MVECELETARSIAKVDIGFRTYNEHVHAAEGEEETARAGVMNEHVRVAEGELETTRADVMVES